MTVIYITFQLYFRCAPCCCNSTAFSCYYDCWRSEMRNERQDQMKGKVSGMADKGSPFAGKCERYR